MTETDVCRRLLTWVRIDRLRDSLLFVPWRLRGDWLVDWCGRTRWS